MKNLTKWTLLATLGALLFVPAATASFVLSDGNSFVTIDPSSQAGASAWNVDGVSQLFQEWFWYRIGNGPQFSIDTLSAPTVVSGANNATVTYTDTGGKIQVEVNFLLVGGTSGSHTADILESIRVKNLTSTAIPFHFYEYSDFDLNGSVGNQSVSIPGPFHNFAQQSGNGVAMSETIVGPMPSRWEANVYANTLNSLNGGVAYNLNNVGSATGDATWAFQWDTSLAGGGAFIVSKDKLIAPVPAPGAVLLGAIGLGVVSWVKRKLS